MDVRQPILRHCLTAERDNLWAALTWMMERNEVEAGLRLAAALHWFWIMRGALSEGRRWLETLLARIDQVEISDLVRANAQFVVGDLARLQHDVSAVNPPLEASLRWYQSAGDQRGMASVLRALGQSALDHGEPAHGVTLIDESLARYRELADTHGSAEALLSRSSAAAEWEGDYARATTLAEESVRLFRQVGDLRGIRTALSQLGWWFHDQGDLAHGAELVEEALGLSRDLGDRQAIMDGLGHLAVIAYRHGDLTRAQMLLEEQLVLAGELGNTNDLSGANLHLGVMARYAGNLAQAQVLLAEALRLGPPGKAGFWHALCWRYQADAHSDQGDVDHAGRLYRESLAVFHDVGPKWDCVACIEGLATVAGAQGHAARAVRLWSSAAAIRGAMRAPLPPVDRPPPGQRSGRPACRAWGGVRGGME
jgi:tetratricopeptide (TPR) repeat protein